MWTSMRTISTIALLGGALALGTSHNLRGMLKRPLEDLLDWATFQLCEDF